MFASWVCVRMGAPGHGYAYARMCVMYPVAVCLAVMHSTFAVMHSTCDAGASFVDGVPSGFLSCAYIDVLLGALVCMLASGGRMGLPACLLL